VRILSRALPHRNSRIPFHLKLTALFLTAWLQTRVNLEELKVDDDYCEQRLGFKGPNVLVMTLQED
jgi:hypothetical protein